MRVTVTVEHGRLGDVTVSRLGDVDPSFGPAGQTAQLAALIETTVAQVRDAYRIEEKTR